MALDERGAAELLDAMGLAPQVCAVLDDSAATPLPLGTCCLHAHSGPCVGLNAGACLQEGAFKFQAPVCVTLIDAAAQGTLLATKPVVHIAVEMPGRLPAREGLPERQVSAFTSRMEQLCHLGTQSGSGCPDRSSAFLRMSDVITAHAHAD